MRPRLGNFKLPVDGAAGRHARPGVAAAQVRRRAVAQPDSAACHGAPAALKRPFDRVSDVEPGHLRVRRFSAAGDDAIVPILRPKVENVPFSLDSLSRNYPRAPSLSRPIRA